MKLRLEMPFVAKQIRSGSVACWHLGEGDQFGFGTDLCDLVIDHVDTIRRAHPERIVPKRVSHSVRIRASESGILRSILATEGRAVSVGELLGVVSTDPAEPVDGPPPVDAPALRVVADPILPEEDY
jgi:pyruvate/2-oxoglutarate dehydrogenase complex dihydrolipoamide acyltransferase (E2) component